MKSSKILPYVIYPYYIIKLLIGIIFILHGFFNIDLIKLISISNLLNVVILFLGIGVTINSIKNLYKPKIKEISEKIKLYKKERKLELILTLILLILSLFVFLTRFNYSIITLYIILIPVIAGQTLTSIISIFLRTKLNLGFLTILLQLVIIYWQIMYVNFVAKIISNILKKFRMI